MTITAQMKWRKEPHRKIWIGRGKHTVAVISINHRGTYQTHSTASEITIQGQTSDTLAQAKAFAADAEHDQAIEINNPTASDT